MSWRHRIALVALVALIGLPVAGTFCALACAPGSAAVAAHHGPGEQCEGQGATPATSQLSAAAARDCDSHRVTLETVTTPAGPRADLLAKCAPSISGTVRPGIAAPPDPLSVFDAVTPPRAALPATAPLALRI